ncbi:hypothetical protein BGAL_0037g00300 [Botrytis galanthina]|uniref:Uncharacterized protein n=1 Tax=Botrytis galanthina TaxID=278940 RepID=A0A4V4HVN9_9HELO|nr:hypothetical protein BGAL_0037g00300 [Botrytis galanthina]
MSSSASAGSKRPAAAMSSNNHSGSTPKRFKSSQEVMTPNSESDSGSDTPSLTRSQKSSLAYFQREVSENAGSLAFFIENNYCLCSETPATVVATLATYGQILRKCMLEGLHSLQEQKERIDGLIVKTLEYVAPPLLAIEPFALHEHWVLNRRSTFDIVTDMLNGDTDMSTVPYLTTEKILEREALYQETESCPFPIGAAWFALEFDYITDLHISSSSIDASPSVLKGVQFFHRGHVLDRKYTSEEGSGTSFYIRLDFNTRVYGHSESLVIPSQAWLYTEEIIYSYESYNSSEYIRHNQKLSKVKLTDFILTNHGYRVPPALQVKEAFVAADEDKLTDGQRDILKEFVARKHKKLDKIVKAQDLALKDVEPGCRALAAVLKDVLAKKEAARIENKARDINGYEVVVAVIKPALRSQKLARNKFLVTRSIANAQKMLLERHEGKSFRSCARYREHATQREASGILEFSPRKDWKAAHVVMYLYDMLHRESLHWINAAVLPAEEVIEFLKGPERSVEAIKDVKRYARVDPEYAEQWKALSWQAYRELLDDSDSEYDISDEHLGHYDGCIDCYDCED